MSVPSSSALLATTYFGPVQWYQKLCRYPIVEIERMETFPKQTYRNRCVIATANGLQTLTVPVSAP
ncbi:WbqC family protein, partial [Bacteroides heparinolyticus]